MSALVRRTVAPVGLTNGGSTGFALTGDEWDVAIGQIPFMLDPSPQFPFRIKAIGVTQWRVDTSNQVGEQTLGAWWLRSQTSFHGGGGQLYLDGTDPTISSEVAALRFNTSTGVDVWTPGEVTLLNDTLEAKALTTSGNRLVCGLDGTTPVAFVSDGATLYRYASGAVTTVTWGGTGTILALTQDGSHYYAADATGIYQGTLAGGNGTLLWNTGSSNVKIAWIKQRLMAAIGVSIYELDSGGPALPAAKFTHPNASWTWDVLQDGPEAIYAAGHVGSQSVIYKFVLDASGGVPTLTTGISAAKMPVGEIVNSLKNHSDSWMAIATNKGVHVAQFASGGDLQIQLIPNNIGGSATALGARDRFVYSNYVASDGIATLARIDLTFEIKTGLYANAPDLRANARVGTTDSFTAGNVTAIDVYGDVMAFVVDGKGLFIEDTSNKVQNGSLTTSRIRYDTSEAKIYRAIRFRGESGGIIECDVAINADSGGRNVGSLTVGTGGDSTDLPILQPGGEYATATFKLSPDTAGTAPTLHGYLLKSVPTQSRAYLISLPLSCYDFEKLGNGTSKGHVGWSLERLDAIMQMADQEVATVLQQIAGPKNQRRSMQVVIDDIDYNQSLPPRQGSRSGGLLYLTLRTV